MKKMVVRKIGTRKLAGAGSHAVHHFARKTIRFQNRRATSSSTGERLANKNSKYVFHRLDHPIPK